MKVALIVPKGKRLSQGYGLRQRVLDETRTVTSRVPFQVIEFAPSLGILTVGSALDPTAHDVRYLDEEFMSAPEIAAEFIDPTFDLVLLTALDNQANRAYEIADAYRALGVYVVMGGYHASLVPEEALGHADTVIVGEAEETFPAFVEDWLAGRAQRRYDPPRVVDLDRIPIPRFELLERYVGRFNHWLVQVTRGCPRDCSYCSIIALYGQKYRTKSVGRVIEEIRALERLVPHPYLLFADENMFVNRAFSRDLLRALAGEHILFEAQTDVAVADDPELLDLLFDAGCRRLLIGFESVVRESLLEAAPWKARRLDGYAEAVARIQGRGIGIQGVFVVGFDHDTPRVFDDILRFVEETGLWEVDLSIVTPMPGTPLRERWEREGRILATDWDAYNWEDVNHVPLGMTVEELRAGFVRLTRAFNTPSALEAGADRFKALIRSRPA